jgi:hypothetical protein
VIFIDRSLPRSIARALQEVRDDVRWLDDVFEPSASDTEWLTNVGAWGWLVITRDKKILTRPGEKAALIEHKVGAFYLTHTDNPTRWQILKVIVRALDDMVETFDREQRPFLYGLDRNGKLWPKDLLSQRRRP